MNTTLKERIEENKRTKAAELHFDGLFLTGREPELLELKSMDWLTSLSFFWSQLQDISFLKDLKNLTSLDLGFNQLQDISFLKGLTSLYFLDLRSNQIQDFSLGFLENFPNLDELLLFGNPLKYIPNEVVSQIGNSSMFYSSDLPDLKNYLQDLELGKSKNNEVKIIFIGNGSVGKTQVAKRLQEGSNYVFEEAHDSTHGISILEKRFDYKIDGKNEVQANLWDFGGQDIYHATHRLFMQTKALFVLVWDWENEQNPYHYHDGKAYKNEGLLYWLEYAKAFGQGSPIIVLQNKIDRDDRRLLSNLEKELKTKYPIIDFIPLSAKTGKSFSVLEHCINQSFQTHETLQKAFVQELPMSWIATRQAIRALQQQGIKEIDQAHFATICNESGAGATSSETILSFLHQVGVLYYRKGYFSDKIIVDQAWAIEAVYQILDRSSHYYEILAHQQGKLAYQDLCSLWKENDDKERKLFIDFMLSCELCFETTENKKRNTPLEERTFVVPQLLPSEKPQEIDFLSEEVYNLTQQTEVQYTFLPQVFMQRFIVKANKLATVETMWQQGILLNYNDVAYALVEADYDNKIIRIKSNTDAHNFVKEIKIVLENIANEGKMNFKQDDNALKIMALWEKYLKPNTKMTKSEIQNLIAQNRIKEAVTALSQVLPVQEKNSIIMLQGRWNGLERDNNLGILDNRDYSVERNKIVSSLLSLCDNIETPQSIAINKTINVTSGFKGTISNVIDTSDLSKMVTIVEPEPAISKNIFFSYAWGVNQETGEDREKIVNELYDSLRKDGFEVLRDKVDLGYKGFISDFMTKIGKGDKIIVVVSDKYVRSPYCMFELYEVARNCKFEKAGFRDKILPLKIEHIDFAKPKVLKEYLTFWKTETEDWEELLKEDMRNLSSEQQDRYNKTKLIFQHFGKLTDWLADMNTLTPSLLSENDFEIIKEDLKSEH